MSKETTLDSVDYEALAAFRHELRRFSHFSEQAAKDAGLTPQQHQALLAIRAANGVITIGHLAEQLMLQPHSASGLVDRLAALDLVSRTVTGADRRRINVHLTLRAEEMLRHLSVAHRDEIRRLRPLLTDLLSRFE
jgi:DNA-binding MarR family transcriptional regulator